MFVLPKRNILLFTPDRTAHMQLKKDVFTNVPEPFTATPYFTALVNDGKIVVPERRKDNDVITANDAAENKIAEKIAEQQTEPEKRRGRKSKN